MHRKVRGSLKVGILTSLILLVLLTPNFIGKAANQEPVTVLSSPAGSLTPGFLSSAVGGYVNSAVYDYLFRIDDEGKVYPSLVDSYEVSEDLTVWKMKIHEGVTFHDGSRLTAEDVVYTVKRLIDPDVGTSLLSIFGPLIDSVKALDEHTVQFDLSRPDAEFHKRFTDYNTAVISSEYNYDELGDTEPMGSGAFKVDRVIPNEKVECSANEDYWLEGVPKIEKLTFSMVPEKETAMRILTSGQGDIVTSLSPDQLRRMEKEPNVKTLTRKLASPIMVDLNTEKEPFDDPKVRKALALTVDRKEMHEIFYGYGSIGNDTPFPQFHEYYDDLGGVRERDIEKAKELLAEAGYPDGLNVTLYCGSDVPRVPTVAMTLQEMARPAGFNIELHMLPRDMYYSEYWLRVPMSITQWQHREPTTQLLKLAFSCDASWNASHYCNEELDKYIEKVNRTQDEDEKQEYYFRIQEILHEDVPALIPTFVSSLHATSERIEGYHTVLNGIDEYRFIELKD